LIPKRQAVAICGSLPRGGLLLFKGDDPMADPKWLTLARKELGTKEIPGPKSNPTVMQYYYDVVGKKFGDSVPWCAAFVGAMLMRSGEKSSGSLMARSYQKYGTRCPAQPGAIAVWSRGNSKVYGHVNFVESVSGDRLTCIGGNQGDAVTRQTYPKSRALSFRWPD
jgi:uncharacterized protein (TIGR02594 family)